MTLPVRAKVLLPVWSYDFYDTTLFIEYQRRNVIKKFFSGLRYIELIPVFEINSSK